MQNDWNHKQWGAADFARYYSGAMPPAERHALEKAALEDPFLQDALDGYQHTATPVKDIAALKQKLWPANTETPIVPIAWYKTKMAYQLYKAASVIIIVGGLSWFLVNKTFNHPANDNSAIAKEQAIQKDSIAIKDALATVSDTTPAIAKLEEKNQQPKVAAESPQLLSDNTAAPSVAQESIPNPNATKTAEVKKETIKADDEAINPVPEQTRAAKQITSVPVIEHTAPVPQMANNLVKGRVVNGNGQPIANARLNNAYHANQQTFTDKNGYFELNNAVAKNQVIMMKVDADGYQARQTSIAENSVNNTIVLQKLPVPQNPVESAAPSGNASKENYRWNGRNTKIQLRNAKPLEGWDYFYYVMNDSITQNKNLQAYKGKLILEFHTNDTGRLENISVKKSLNAAADSMATKILYHSPVLELINKNKKGEAIIKLP